MPAQRQALWFARPLYRAPNCHRQFGFYFRIPDGKKADTRLSICFFGDPSGIRTPDPLLKRQLLCLLS